MHIQTLSHKAAIQPFRALATDDRTGTLAIITGVEGPSYRPVGAAMAIFDDEEFIGTLSSGCVESDIAVHAHSAQEKHQPIAIRYGKNSPFGDIQLPCGGGLDILLIPHPDRTVLNEMIANHDARQPTTLKIDAKTGALSLGASDATGWDNSTFNVAMAPELQFLVFGKGPEAATFAALAHAAGFPCWLYAPDDETLATAQSIGCPSDHLTRPLLPNPEIVDDRTAIVLFFHDHDWEPPILQAALETPAFYIGAQGSHRSRMNRDHELMLLGLNASQIERLRGPIGLVPSARDARTLAVSVLAEILAEAL